MLVDDNETDVFIITDILEKAGFRFRLEIAHDGEDALSRFEQPGRVATEDQPALVLLDLNIPKINGLEVLRRIRRDAHTSGIPVVIITSSESQSDKRAVHSLGANAYFKKPRSIQEYMELAPVVAPFLSRRRG